MAKINRKYIDKHWLVFLFRGALATIFSCFMLFSGITEIGNIITIVSVFLLFMGIVDTVGALYSSTKKHGWLNAVIDALVDVIAALVLLLFTKDNLIYSLIVVAIYVIVSGLIDIFHGFLSTVDPTDRFIRVLTGVAGCIIGAVIINSGDFEMTTFIRFFGAYMLLVGASSLIYGVHNRAQNIEDKVARKEARKHAKRKK
ncbi:DUF308 domain-containing protein [Candidatus Saccharibacteria bacterium]|nr:DUF308 domain-containing protein [Candidatus Saccharibacteria bacterium]